ncbi:MAG: glycine cleavage system aminomethyltransferase GcvT [Candidatus Bathyarchaeota archaeon]|nr:glycine cleavage system aminomethyltransferase GcvT [Candidatus Bathyarchaeota archaeon]
MELQKTHLYNFHKSNGHLIDFAGFEMPIWYDGIISEHLAVRNDVGIFDVTHMGRCIVEGKGAADLLNYILTRDVASSSIGQGRYSVMCNENGGIIDDLVAFRLEDEKYFMVYNASNRKKDFEFIKKNAQSFDAKVKDVSDEIVMVAVQGPKSVNVLQNISDSDLSSIRYYWGSWVNIEDQKVFITRTGYTGEDGFEIFLWDTPLTEVEKAERFWQIILGAGREYGIKPIGLGARDTLRLEAGMCLYGNDMNEDTTPLESRLSWVVQFEKKDFVGKKALLRQKSEGIKRKLAGFRLLEKGVPRPGNKILFDGKEIGQLTSGTFSPLLRYGIGLGHVFLKYAELGTQVDISIRNKTIKAEVTDIPFYDTLKYGRKRQNV